MRIEIYGVEFMLKENQDSRKEVYPYILHVFSEDCITTIYLEEKEHKQLKKAME